MWPPFLHGGGLTGALSPALSDQVHFLSHMYVSPVWPVPLLGENDYVHPRKPFPTLA